MKKLQWIYPHLWVIAGFILVALVYFYPVLKGQKIYQSDIAQFTGMAKEQNDFRKEFDAEPYWTNSAFGGMPTYQLGANYPHNYIKKLDSIIRFLPRPADYLFLYFVGFYLLLISLKTDTLKAFIGALAFGLSTYLIIILGVGHNAKAHAIAYMPMVLAGIILVFQKRWIVGGLLTTFAVALEINANHFQMTYYLFFLILIIGAYYAYEYIKDKEYKQLVTAIGILLTSGIIAVGVNATNLMATAEYAQFSTRSNSELTFEPDGKPKVSNNAMTYDYITEYSYGIAESLNLIAPRLFGGSNSEKLGTDSKMNDFLISQGVAPNQVSEILNGLPTYWGDQPIVAAPAYIGVIVFFLAVLALFVDNRKIKYAFLAGAVFSLMLSWGKNFPLLTNLFIDYLPLYNKFRAVSSIQVLLELCMPVLAVMGLQSFFDLDKTKQWKNLWQSGAITLGLLGLLFLAKGMFSFAGGSDAYLTEAYGYAFTDALKQDRKSMYTSDLLRSMFFVSLVGGVLWAFTQEKIKKEYAVIAVGLIMVFDMFSVAKRYVDSNDFVQASYVDEPFQKEPQDEAILKDTSHYRVFEVDGALSSARTSYFHQSIGGYHAAKPRRMQQLFDYQIAKNNIEVLNMLNVKYVVQSDDKGNKMPGINDGANGNAWFVSDIQLASTADEEMKALTHFKSKKTAIINHKEFPAFKHKEFTPDSLATIRLTSYQPNCLIYESNNTQKGLAVFSEIYYPKGWNAYINGKLVPHIRANYALRALEIPAGKQQITFKFEPQVVQTGSTIALISFILLLVLVGGGVYSLIKKEKALV